MAFQGSQKGTSICSPPTPTEETLAMVPEQEAGFSDRAVPDDQDFKHVVEILQCCRILTQKLLSLETS